ncbi:MULTISPECIES: AAA family ATPase [Acinetobacter]|jgi:predicted ATP-dependent endonuclease of OLD family|uniref:AAA family ATPase n=2 Tax=Acinetobacter pittii TaxID=48296 RepID=A0A242U4W5_ACIPI|nr:MULTISPECIES: AAA family ATPase [Acinetobacter]MBJ8501841.1 AAA family ATPase [Acinetobacter pittii]MBJ9892274.1 AAA family ATPase [Acinetobacter pittii]MCU4480011.1 AAA family ATPase [Acinetobacter sp. WU_MDCI_Abxd143]OTU27898.1 AAA family ATPase [Acinetobacter pittii]
MIKLKNIEILKYKSFTTPQSVHIEDDITVLVGMNESGKTSILECLAKTNYFETDEKFKFNQTLDYPRKELKSINKSDENPNAIICRYKLSKKLIDFIEHLLGKGTWQGKDEITVTSSYKDGATLISGVSINFEAFLKHYNLSSINESLKKELKSTLTISEFDELLTRFPEDSDKLEPLKKYFFKSSTWNSFIERYVYTSLIKKHLPKFIYYDEYYQLPSRIVLENFLDEGVELSDDLKTAKALLDLADININDIINTDDFEDFIAELEATEALISDTLFQYWSANQDLNIEFKIDKKTATAQRHVNTNYGNATTVDTNIVEHVLDIRVKNSKTRVSLPLQNRSKGFNWFFSFLVWFNKIQADSNSKYILLLDEPGLNLHATAQADLLRFLESLVDKYQVIYTTHSPFMVETTKLNRVRTVFSDSDSSIVSDSIQQKDPNTLFPLQAALGYDVAQNLFISKKNLLVEGVSDLLYLTTISEYLNANSRTGLNEDITIVPTGGLDKVASFISLLRGSKLSIFCLLDSFTDQKSQARFDSLTIQKIISDKNIKFFHDYLDNRKKADIEDMFTVDEYLQLFNISLSSTHAEIKVDELSVEIEDILSKINKVIKKNRFNHYLPAKEFASNKDFVNSLSESTLSRFETIFKEINKNLK